MLINFSVKAQGASHVEKNTPCQDAAHACLSKNKRVGVAIVADGHGGSKYFRSDKGSVLAVQTAERTILDFLGTIAKNKAAFFARKEEDRKIKQNLKLLEEKIIVEWRNGILHDLKDNPLTEQEKEFCKSNNIVIDDDPANLLFIYGTTLLAGLISDSFWFVLQIGDGRCVVIESENNITIPITEDERLAFGRTTSLCDNNANENFREAFGFTEIQGLTLATDGISDSFEPEKYIQFNKELYDKFTVSPENTTTELQAFLPELSERGSRDDVSIAGIFRVKREK